MTDLAKLNADDVRALDLWRDEICTLVDEAFDAVASRNPNDKETATAYRYAVHVALSRTGQLVERDGVAEALEAASEALAKHACHYTDAPCLRSKIECDTDCGFAAGNALVKVSAALRTRGASHD